MAAGRKVSKGIPHVGKHPRARNMTQKAFSCRKARIERELMTIGNL